MSCLEIRLLTLATGSVTHEHVCSVAVTRCTVLHRRTDDERVSGQRESRSEDILDIGVRCLDISRLAERGSRLASQRDGIRFLYRAVLDGDVDSVLTFAELDALARSGGHGCAVDANSCGGIGGLQFDAHRIVEIAERRSVARQLWLELLIERTGRQLESSQVGVFGWMWRRWWRSAARWWCGCCGLAAATATTC